MSLKRELNFFENFVITDAGIADIIHVEPPHIIYDSGDKLDTKWIEESTYMLKNYSEVIRSTYTRWALAVNGLNLGFEKYNADGFKGKAFCVSSARFIDDEITPVNIIAWDGPTAAQNHIDTVNMLASYGIIDLYSLLEELVIKLFKTYLFHNPQKMIEGKDNRNYRILYRDRHENPQAWKDAWNKRLDNWHRKKIYDGISKILISYYEATGLKVPVDQPNFTLEMISTSLKSISVLRNCLIHGATNVPKELAEVSNIDKVNEFDFKEGDKIDLSLNHLIAIEQFTNAFVASVNVSLMERLIL